MWMALSFVLHMSLYTGLSEVSMTSPCGPLLSSMQCGYTIDCLIEQLGWLQWSSSPRTRPITAIYFEPMFG
ncbi:hypothetical protein ACHAWF_000493, partial [Thalassiosira exigua]